MEDNVDDVHKEIPSIEDEIECYSQSIWGALLGFYDRYGNFDTTSTMLCSKCDKPDPFPFVIDNSCTECCLPYDNYFCDPYFESPSPRFSSWELAKQELDMIFEDIKKFHMPFKKSMHQRYKLIAFIERYIERLRSVEAEYPQGDHSHRFMCYDYTSFLQKYCPPVLLDMILNFRHDNKYTLLERVFVKYMDCDRVHQNVKRLLRLCSPLEYYPRKSTDSKRCISFHYGPTNSGKTFEALKSFKGEGKSAIYCAPLRLLAMQIYQDVNKEGILCDLKTGEDVKHHSGSVKCCCTVELADLSKKWEVAVIDEIQMIGDEQRGGAWTRAFLGLNAQEIHLCGEGSVSELIQQLCKLTGDQLTMVKHHRRSELVVEDEALLLQKGKIESGDCFVAFSVRKLKEIKRRIFFYQPDMKCTLLYGSLPPQVKFEAAEKFMKDCENQKGVLIATDAIGMGLNLPIRRVIFTETEKYDGDSVSYVKIPLVKQIAGRAGRGSENGYCTATHPSDLKYLRKCVEAPIEPIKQAVLELDPKILPILEHRWRKLEEFTSSDFVEYLRSFESRSLLSGCVENAYKPLFRFRSFQKEFWNVAYGLTFDYSLQRITLSDFFKLCNCPYGDSSVVRSWMSNMFLSFTDCLFNYEMDEYNCESVYGRLRAYKYLYNQFPQQRDLMIHYDRLPELELQIKTLIREKEKKEEENWLRYHSDSDSD